jgi:hypothetical protein
MSQMLTTGEKQFLAFQIRLKGKNDDPDLLAKLTTEEELSGIFNVLMDALRDILLKIP